MNEYIRKVHYYETDRMGITHHSNYIRWMEEARTYFLDQIGYGYARMESEGITSPVIAVECQYHRPSTFDDKIKIQIEAEKYTGILLTVKYIMTNAVTGELLLTGKTEHCFLGQDNKPIIVKKKFPQLDSLLKRLTVKTES